MPVPSNTAIPSRKASVKGVNPLTRRLVINADDLGICESTNEAISLAHREGVVSSASLMANGPACEHAVECVVRNNPNLGIGLHVCLTSGRSLLPANEIPLLVDRDRVFRHGFLSLWRQTRTRGCITQLYREVDAQFSRLERLGIEIDHVDSHQHIHLIPALHRVVTHLAQQHGCRIIRCSDEPLKTHHLQTLFRSPATFGRNLPKKVLLSILARCNRGRLCCDRATKCTLGIIDSGNISRWSLRRLALSAGRGVTEIIVHPGRHAHSMDPSLSQQDQAFLQSPNRKREFEALIQPALRDELQHAGIELMTFAQVEKPCQLTERPRLMSSFAASTPSARLRPSEAARSARSH